MITNPRIGQRVIYGGEKFGTIEYVYYSNSTLVNIRFDDGSIICTRTNDLVTSVSGEDESRYLHAMKFL